MSATVTPLEQEAQGRLKDFLIFRVYECDGHYELADDSALAGEAARYADLVADAEPENGIHYEVRAASSAALLHTTEDTEHEDGQATWIQAAT